jgi:transposase
MLAEFVARRRQLVEMIGMESKRRRQARNSKVLKGIERTLSALQATLAELDGEIENQIKRARRSGGRPRICSPPSPASARSPPAP